MSDKQPPLQASSGHMYLNEHAGLVTKTAHFGLPTYLQLREPGQRRLA
jgi:hypothetical protein